MKMFVLVFAVSVIAGMLAFWVVGRFSGDPPNMFESGLGALIYYGLSVVLGLFGLSGLLSGIVLYFVLIKLARMGAIPALLGTFLFTLVSVVISAILFAVFGVRFV